MKSRLLIGALAGAMLLGGTQVKAGENKIDPFLSDTKNKVSGVLSYNTSKKITNNTEFNFNFAYGDMEVEKYNCEEIEKYKSYHSIGTGITFSF